MRRDPVAPIHVDTITDRDVTVRVWLDTDPGMPAILVYVDEFGQELHLPIEVARQVAAAITRATAPAAAWCKPVECTA